MKIFYYESLEPFEGCTHAHVTDSGSNLNNDDMSTLSASTDTTCTSSAVPTAGTGRRSCLGSVSTL